jgi:hypothetical protein
MNRLKRVTLISAFVLIASLLGMTAANGTDKKTQKPEDYVSTCIASLGYSVPSGFARVNKTVYKKEYGDADIFLEIEDGKVAKAIIARDFKQLNEINGWTTPYQEFFKNQSWEHCGAGDGAHGGFDMYRESGIYARVQATVKTKGKKELAEMRVIFFKEKDSASFR